MLYKINYPVLLDGSISLNKLVLSIEIEALASHTKKSGKSISSSAKSSYNGFYGIRSFLNLQKEMELI